MRGRQRVLLSVALMLVLVLPLAASGWSKPAVGETTQEAFIRGLVTAAQKNQAQTGIPASVAIGMAALETGWGRSSMAKDPINSYYNIKCTATVSPYQNGCVDIPSYEYNADGSRYLLVSKFRTYATVGDSLMDYGRLLTSLSRYAPAFQYTNDPDQFVREVRKGGYATDPKYADLVISIMKGYNLYRYDLGGGSAGGPVAGGPNAEAWRPGPLPTKVVTPSVIPSFVAGADFPAYAVGWYEPGVRTLQRLLNETNAAGLATDARFGPLTDAAVRNWQNRIKAKATGVMDDVAWRALLPTLAPGATGQAVTALQEELTQAGYSVPVTGTFDARTAEAVKQFQTKHRIEPTGQVTHVVWARLLDW